MAAAVSFVDIWPSILRHAVEWSPEIVPHLEDVRRETLRIPSSRKAANIAIAIVLGLERDSVNHKRIAERLFALLMEDDVEERDALAESLPEALPFLPDDAVLIDLKHTLEWICSEPPLKLLANAPTIREAIRLLHDRAPALRGLAAYQWLEGIGFPVVVPDAARRRFFQRVGIVPPGTDTEGQRRATAEALEGLSSDARVSPREVDLVLDSFTGASRRWNPEAAVCLKNPACGRCPVRAKCYYARMQEKEPRTPSRVGMPAERLIERVSQSGAEALSDEELLALILRTGTARETSVEIARRLLEKVGSLQQMSRCSMEEFLHHEGIGPSGSAALVAAVELARRIGSLADDAAEGPAFDSSEKVFEHFRRQFIAKTQEECVALLLNAKLRLIRQQTLTRGLLDESLLDAREVFRDAIKASAHSVIVVHNHPSGDPNPSDHDRRMTKKLLVAGKLIGIEVIDHVIVAGSRYFSFADAGLIDGSGAS